MRASGFTPRLPEWPAACASVVGISEDSPGGPCGEPVSLVIDLGGGSLIPLCAGHREWHDTQAGWKQARAEKRFRFIDAGGQA